ncbi:MAG: hypothetical protein CM1200mP22_03560 [Dehalococcoidia bacterium]|nr:MAG: hypothetical protein CM1200mP22_03560 [Dehalococcoidia bacterium]
MSKPLAAGLARVFQMPTAQSLAVDSVPTDRISNAVALISGAMNLACFLDQSLEDFYLTCLARGRLRNGGVCLCS